ncbi:MULTISPECIES: SpoIIE family protein phosphatase [unclassified Streptomyces]|uniref:SpoIIE family protein phosphatase n=1 Tax=unclassified Streptomyces TaxID=2593676 RepID=UPI0033C9154C
MQHPAAAHTAAGAAAELLDAVLADVVRDTGASAGFVYLLPPGERALRMVLVCGVSRRIVAPWARIPWDAEAPLAEAVRQRRLIWLGSQEEIARRYPQIGAVVPYDFMVAAAPITGADTVWGSIGLLWPVWHPPQLSADEQETITACCRRAAALLQQATDSGRPLRPADEPRLLPAPHLPQADPAQAMAALDFTERLSIGCCALDLDGKLTFLNAAGAELLGADAAHLMGNRPWEVLPWLYDPIFEDHYRAAVIARQPISFTAQHPSGTWLFFQLYPDGSGISVHITHAEKPVATKASNPAPPPDEPVGATALYHLTHIAAALGEAVGAHDVVEQAADQIVPAFGPTAMALMTVEEGRLRIIGYRGYSPDLMARFDAAPLTADTPAAAALTTGVPSFYSTFADLKRSYPTAVHLDDKSSWAFLPLIASGHPVGTLVLAYDKPRPYPPAERAILTSLAGLIAQALGRARLYDAKHELAHTLQTGLLPRTLPRLAGLEVTARYRPARNGMDIGGDFYDLIRCTPTTAVAVIGDVQGHNTTAAAALMGQVRTAVHAHATAGATPGDILARTNRLLTDLDPGLFASCLIAHLDLTHHRAQLATAGHPPALLRHPDGPTDILRIPPGLLLGIAPDAHYQTTDIALPPGAVLALYTDGLVESPGTDIDDATTALAAHLTSAQTQNLDTLAETLIHYAEQAAPLNDDIALLLIRPHNKP